MKTFKVSRALFALLLPVLFGFGPCGPIAGGEMSGSVVTEQVKDFQFVGNVEHCALEVNTKDPHSVTVNCWTVGKQLFVGCKDCEAKKWSKLVSEDPVARIKIGEKVYPVSLNKMSDEFAINRAWRHRWDKYGDGDLTDLPAGYWLYHLASQP